MAKNSPIKVALITIGSELLDGRTIDTNANFLATNLSRAGFRISNILSCHDQIKMIVEAISFAYLQGAELILTSGGLGPTTDDLTREAVAEYFQVGLFVDQSELQKQMKRYADRGKEFPISNTKQATFPVSAEIIKNNFGTAPAFSISSNNQRLISLPGVPSELKGIFSETILPALLNDYSPSKTYQSRFVLFNLPESALNDQVTGLNLSADLEIIYETTFPENKLILKTADLDLLTIAEHQILERLPNQQIVAREEAGLPAALHQLLLKSDKTLAIAESCTGGLVSKLLTDFSGSSSYLQGSIVAYHNDVKERVLNVSKDILETHGAVSAECAKAMAQNVRKNLRSDFGLSITGIAGPTGGTTEKPIGTVFIGYADQSGVISQQIFFAGTREQVQRYAAFYALWILMQKLKERT